MAILWIGVGVLAGVVGTVTWLAWYFKDTFRG